MNRKKQKRQKNSSEEKYKMEVMGSLGPEDFFDDCPVCQAEKSALERGRPLTAQELKDAFQKAKEKGAVVGGTIFEKDNDGFSPEDLGLEPIGTPENFEMPKWMECTWRRVPCGKDECKICGKINQDRLRHIMKGENPDDVKSAMEDVGNSLSEALRMIKQHTEEMGIDLENIGEKELEEPPEPEQFPLYQKVEEWKKSIEDIANEAEMTGAPWIFTEAAADLFWYKNTLSAKTYRQLCNRWHLDRKDEYGEFDYQYTKYVLIECLLILKRSLSELISSTISERSRFTEAVSRLNDLEQEILNI